MPFVRIYGRGQNLNDHQQSRHYRLAADPQCGPAIAAKMWLIGISSAQDLAGKDPYEMYEYLCDITRVRHDHCLLDVFIAAVRFMDGKPAKPWWK
jgi:hypothetical protein